jgi:hypothetical protein
LVGLGEIVIEPLLEKLGDDAATDFFIARVLGELATLEYDWSPVRDYPLVRVRFAFYDACTDTVRLSEALAREQDKRLRVYLEEKLSRPASD